jgi:hypothetical protein
MNFADVWRYRDLLHRDFVAKYKQPVLGPAWFVLQPLLMTSVLLGFTGDYVEGMWLILQQSEADGYVLATDQTAGVQTFCELAAAALDYELSWGGRRRKHDRR